MKRNEWKKITPSAWACDEWAVQFDAHVDHLTKSHLSEPFRGMGAIETATSSNAKKKTEQVADWREQEYPKCTERARQSVKEVNQCD